MRKLTNNGFIDRAINVHGDRYDYSLVNYINSRTKIDIICPKHGEFSQNPNNHLNRKSKCPLCRNDDLLKMFALSNLEFINKAINIHGDKYDYSKVKYVNGHTKVIIICSVHGEFLQNPYNHLNGSGCSKCCKIKLGKKYALSLDEFIRKANIIHKNEYDYKNVIYKNCMTKINIICSKHGTFTQTPNSHLSGQGCPNCRKSIGENIILDFLVENKIEFIREKKFKECFDKDYLRFDFFLPKHNLLIEYDGEQHGKVVKHWGGKNGLIERKKRDMIKNLFVINNKMNLLRLPYVLLEYNEIVPTLKHALML